MKVMVRRPMGGREGNGRLKDRVRGKEEGEGVGRRRDKGSVEWKRRRWGVNRGVGGKRVEGMREPSWP